MRKVHILQPGWRSTLVRLGLVLLVTFLLIGTTVWLLVVRQTVASYNLTGSNYELTYQKEPFPVGVNRYTKTIDEQPLVENYKDAHFANTPATLVRNNWYARISTLLYTNAWYQGLATPASRILVIWAGDRHEEVTKNFSDILGWSEAEREQFVRLVQSAAPELREGKFIPGQYTVSSSATPEDVATLLIDRFYEDMLARYTDETEAAVPFEEALIVASLLEREAYSFSDMRAISGVIWNRLFIDMPLQLDATLQYARANDPTEPEWWPVPVPSDKFIESPFNTYENKGLPPTPIANPSPAAVLAALNPLDSNCLFYFHDDDGAFHCSKDYETHVDKLRSLYGRGE